MLACTRPRPDAVPGFKVTGWRSIPGSGAAVTRYYDKLVKRTAESFFLIKTRFF